MSELGKQEGKKCELVDYEEILIAEGVVNFDKDGNLILIQVNPS